METTLLKSSSLFTKQIMVISVSGAALNVILNYFFINKYGYHAAGYTTLVCYILYSFGHYLLMSSICRKRDIGKSLYDPVKLAIITVAFLLMGFVLLFTYSYPILRYSLIACMIVASVIFRKKAFAVVTDIFENRKHKLHIKRRTKSSAQKCARK